MGFKKDFLWGSSTSAYQVEGGFDEDGKGLSVQDVKELWPGTPDFKVASDHYHRYREDVELFHQLGLKSYRFSIAWTRIFPQGDGEVNEKGVEFYNNLIDALLEKGIEPLVTMFHFDLPLALKERGGWSSRETVDAFTNYAKTLFERFGDRVKYWLTINEQNMMILHAKNVIEANDADDLYQQNHHMLLAQAKTMVMCHQMLPEAKIGPAPNIAVVYPQSNKPEDILAAQYVNVVRNWLYLDMAVYGEYNALAMDFITKKGYQVRVEPGDMEIMKNAKPDFIALNYYTTASVKAYEEKTGENEKVFHYDEKGFYEGVVNENLSFTEFGWQVDPLGFRITLNEVYSRYRLPIIVTENGLGAYDQVEEDGSINDPYRIEYLRNHIQEMKKACESGVEMWGYYTWSVMDLISTHQGFDKRYGFIYVNRDNENLKDLSRIKKQSFGWYNKVINSNGEDLD